MNIPLNISLQQILLHLFNFAILAGGLYFLLYKPVKNVMDQRTAHYQEMEDAAQEKLRQAEELNASYGEKLRGIDEEIRQERAKAQKAVKAITDQRLAEAQAQADSIVAEAEKSAARSREKSIADAQKELQNMAVTATEKLVLQSGGNAFDQFLDIAERGGKDER